MIRTFADAATADLFNGVDSKAARTFAKALWTVIAKRLDALNRATGLRDLQAVHGHRLHAMHGGQQGRYSIRINQQYRLTFRFVNGDAYEVRCEDYHD